MKVAGLFGLNRMGVIRLVIDNRLLVLSSLLLTLPLDQFLVANKLLSLGCGRRRYD